MDGNKSDVIKRSSKKHKKVSKKMLILIFTAVAVIFAAVSLIVHFATRVTNESYVNCAVGDVDGNGTINASDALLILNYTANDAELFENQIKLADVNLDGIVDSKDALLIFKYAIGTVKSLPYAEDTSDSGDASGSLNAEIVTEESKTSARIVNIWDNGDGTVSYQLNIVVKNLTDESLDGQNIKITCSNDIRIAKSWDCQCEANDTVLSVNISPVEEKSTATCGVILTGNADLVINHIEKE